jgi:hypothetical protein
MLAVLYRRTLIFRCGTAAGRGIQHANQVGPLASKGNEFTPPQISRMSIENSSPET